MTVRALPQIRCSVVDCIGPKVVFITCSYMGQCFIKLGYEAHACSCCDDAYGAVTM